MGPQSETERMEQEQGFRAIEALMEASQTIAVCAHTSPDGDALGTELALMEAILRRWPHKEVVALLADDAPVPRIYQFLPGSQKLVRPSDYTGCPDLFVGVDMSELVRLNRARGIAERSLQRAILDHHPTDNPFATARVIRPGAAAAGVIVAEFIMYLDVDITPSMAQNLLCAIVTDTGRYQYQNTDAEAFGVSSMLIAHGASSSEISLNVYQSFRLQFLHLKSIIMGRITTFEHGRIAYSYATQSDLDRTGADLDEADGLIDVVRSVEGSEVALFLKSVGEGKIRGNLRSKGSHDVSSVARMVGGGGHRAAAGFTIEGTIDEALSAVLPPLRALVRGVDPTSSGLDATVSLPILSETYTQQPSTTNARPSHMRRQGKESR